MRVLLLASALLIAAGSVPAADSPDPYREIKDRLYHRRSGERIVPEIPPAGEKLRVIIDTDAHNEIDDVWALALALLSPERFEIVGFVATNYDNDNEGAGPRSIETSAATIHEAMTRCGLAGRYPVKLGSPPMRYRFEPSKSEGVDFIVEQAMAATPEKPLWIVGLGAATNLASAYLQEPRIAGRVVMFWHGRTEWPHKANNFNVHGDVRAAQILFHSDIPFVLFDTGGHLSCPMEESAAWVQHGEIGRYLHEFRSKDPWYQSATKGFYDLGDIAALLDPTLAQWEVVDCPEVAPDLAYRFTGKLGRILRCGDIDRDRTFALLDRKIREAAAAPSDFATVASSSEPVPRVIFDTDVGGDIDDAGALAMLHALADRGEVELLAMGVVNGHPAAVPYVDALNTWYGRPDLPVGTIRDGAPFSRDEFMQPIVAAFPHDLTQSDAPDVVRLYRRVLAAQPDRSVTLIVVGPATNISRLLQSPADEYSALDGAELVRRKVRFYGAGGNGDGNLPSGKPGFNYQMDPAAARTELTLLPADVPMVFAGGSGFQLLVGNGLERAPASHLVRQSFEHYFKGADDLDRPTWDQLRVLYAARPSARAAFETSEWGDIQMDASNYIHWKATPVRNRAYAYVRDAHAVKRWIDELMIHEPKQR